jgi:protein TonB
MKADYILQADLLDIIFENRNKAYGAYPLRRYYEGRIYKALGIIIFLLALFSVYNLLREGETLLAPVIVKDVDITKLAEERKPQESIKQREKKPDPVKSVIIASSFRLVDSMQKTDPIRNLDSLVTGRERPGVSGDPQIVPGGDPPAGPGGSGPGIAPVTPTPPDRNIPVAEADIMPSFPGGMKALTKFMERNLTANIEELEQGTMVSVKIRFVVGYDGVLKSFEIIEDGGEKFNKEVIRVLKKMPDWIPGKTKGENVSVWYTIPVKFIGTE